MGGILQLLRQLIQSGSGLGNALARRYLPARFHRTRTDEGIEYMKGATDTMTKYMGRTVDELDAITRNKIAQGQKIIDDVQKMDPRFANQESVRRAFNQVNKEVDELVALHRTLINQARLTDDMATAAQIMERANQVDKTAALLKSAIPILGAGGAGMYFGARSEDANPDFYKPETDPFRDQPDEADEAVQDMTEKSFGEKTANVLMDILSPIPRYKNDGREQ